jgi:putative ABC transport system permease protein
LFLKFILGALKYRRQRLFLAFSALAVAAALATVLFDVYGSVEQRLRNEFGAYGANILAVPLTGNVLPLAIATEAKQLGADAAPFSVTSGRIGQNQITVLGFMPEATKPLTPYWHVEGTRELARGECLAGETLAARLQLKIGSPVPLDSGACTLKGIVSTGGAEDRELLVFGLPQRGQPSLNNAVASFVEIRAPGDRRTFIRRALATQFPTADFREIRSVADTESTVVLRIRASVFLLTLLVLVITTLCVTGNFTEMVIERAKEIAILKSLGAAERRIAAFFISESAALAFVATIAGYIAGLLAAAALARNLFGGAFHVQTDWLVFAGVALVMLAVAAISTGIAVSRIWTIQPAIILRGE